jgi:MFS family permease
MALWFPHHEMGRAIGLQSIGMPIGIMLGLNATPLFSHALHSWQLGLCAMAVVPLAAMVVTIPVAIASRRIRKTIPSAELNRDLVPASEFLRTPTFWVGLVALCLCYWAGMAFNGLAPGFLAVDAPVGAGYGPQGAGSLMLVFALSGIVGPPVGGFVVDKLFNGRSKPLIAIGWILGAVCYTAILLPAVSSNRPLLEMVLLIAGLSNPFIDVTLMSFVAKIFPPRVVGRVAGLWLSCAMLTGSVSMMAGSLALRTTGTYTLSLLIIGAACVIGFAVASLLTQPRHAQAARTDFSVN